MSDEFQKVRERFNARHDPAKEAFEMALSPLLMASAAVAGDWFMKKLSKVCEDTVRTVRDDNKKAEIAKIPIPSPGKTKLVRSYPVSIRSGGPDGPIIFETVTYWNEETNRYRILIENPGEGWIESGTPQSGMN